MPDCPTCRLWVSESLSNRSRIRHSLAEIEHAITRVRAETADAWRTAGKLPAQPGRRSKTRASPATPGKKHATHEGVAKVQDITLSTVMRLVLDTKVLVSGLLSLTDAYPILTPADFVNRFMS